MAKGLGRHPFMDVRRGMHLMREILKVSTVVVPDHKVWKHGIILDQGEEGACVGFSWTAWENCAPIGRKVQQDNTYAFGWYQRAKEIDPWPGTDYDGTAVSAGADVARERNTIERYLWAGSKEEIDAWLLTKGPVVVGSDWFYSMDDVGAGGYIRVEPKSRNRGGHAYLLIGKRDGRYVFQNSWGESYGDDGLFYMNGENFKKLVAYGNAEFCTALQSKAVA